MRPNLLISQPFISGVVGPYHFAIFVDFLLLQTVVTHSLLLVHDLPQYFS